MLLGGLKKEQHPNKGTFHQLCCYTNTCINAMSMTCLIFEVAQACSWTSLGWNYTFYRDLFSLEIMQVTKENFLPVAPVADETQIRQRSLWRANFFFYFRKQIACKEKEIYFSFPNYSLLTATLQNEKKSALLKAATHLTDMLDTGVKLLYQTECFQNDSLYTYWSQWASCHSLASCTGALSGYKRHCNWEKNSSPKNQEYTEQINKSRSAQTIGCIIILTDRTSLYNWFNTRWKQQLQKYLPSNQ